MDAATIEAAARLSFPGNVDLIVVPDRQPRTKPKALNYALQFATGDLAVIYDAEDRPEPDQLRKAATAFHHASADVACLQARLDYFNPGENWLSRQFTIEYATLFRGLLPLLSRFGLPLPLGGTSNHFRIGVLRVRLLPNECPLRFFCFRRVLSQNREGHFCELCLERPAQPLRATGANEVEYFPAAMPATLFTIVAAGHGCSARPLKMRSSAIAP